MPDAQTVLKDRKTVYTLTFGSPEGKEVLKDLAAFCRANESCFNPDSRVNTLLEGRREVWLRIMEYIQLSEEEIYRLHIPRKGI